MFAHHPDCDEYSAHTWRLGPFTFCKTCSVGFLLLNSLLVSFLLIPKGFNFFADFYSNIFLLLILSPLVIFYLVGATKGRLKDVLQITFIIFAVILGLSFIYVENPFGKIVFLAWISFGLILLFLFRKKKMFKICRECEYEANFGECPGLESFRDFVYSLHK